MKATTAGKKFTGAVNNVINLLKPTGTVKGWEIYSLTDAGNKTGLTLREFIAAANKHLIPGYVLLNDKVIGFEVDAFDKWIKSTKYQRIMNKYSTAA